VSGLHIWGIAVKDNLLWRIAVTFASLSFVAVGGVTAALPGIHRQVVNVQGWMNDTTFANLYALAQAAPGPNVIVVGLIGWHITGLAGLAVAMLAMVVPSSILALIVGRIVHRHANTSWIVVAKTGLVPVTIGLILAGGVVMARAADRSILKVIITLAAAIFVLRCERNPAWALAAGTIISLGAWWLAAPR
jgi:chromate transporter